VRLLPSQGGAKPSLEGGTLLVAGEHPLDGASLGAGAHALLCHGRIWFFVLTAACLYTGGGGLISFITSFAVHALHWEDHHATLLVTCLGTGLIIGAILAGPAKDLMSASTLHLTNGVIIFMHGLAHFVVLTLLTSGSTDALSSAMPVLAVFLGVPLSWLGSLSAVFAVRFAGPRHAATLSGLGDLATFALLAPFNLLVNYLIENGHFLTYWYITASLLVGGSTGFVVLLRLEERLPPHATLPKPLGLGVAAPAFSVGPLQAAST